MEKIVEQGLLYDYYGELLTEHQKKIYEDAVYQDLSLSEIAEEAGISRQGVHDLIKRCDKILKEYEDKLHLLEKSLATREKIEEIVKISGGEKEDSGEAAWECLRQIYEKSQSLLEEL